eukprot:jgi/Astpho2/2067/e_gw1.00038.70.1_t
MSTPAADARRLWKPAWQAGQRAFVMAYFTREGLGLLTRILTLLRAGKLQDLASWKLLSGDRGLAAPPACREDAVKLALFVGGFTGSYHLLRGGLQQWMNQSHTQACFTAGCLAGKLWGSLSGITLLFQKRERRRTLALYTLARLAQCYYNSQKQQGRWHAWGSDWQYGDALLFAVSSAQIMYSYVMNPKTLPASYWNFIVRTGPIHEVVLEAVRRNVRKQPVNIAAVNSYIRRNGGRTLLQDPFPRQIGAAVLHPHTRSPVANVLRAARNTFSRTFPLYLSINLVPYVVLNFRNAAKAPLMTSLHAALSAARSTSFLSAFVGLYQMTISAHRALCKTGDFKLLYFAAGWWLVASGSILMEKRSRRSELALYVFPRALDSFLLTVTPRGWVPSLRFGEVALFSLCMGALMYYREHEPSTMSPLIRSLLSRIVLGQPSKPTVQLQRVPTFNFLAEDILGASDLRTSDQPGAAGELKEIAAVQESGQQGAQAS